MEEFYRAPSITLAYEKLLENPNNQIIGGGAWLKLTKKNVHTVIDLEDCQLSGIKEEQDYVVIGAMTTLYEVEKSNLITSLGDGVLSKAISKIMGVGIKNIATIGGSIVGKYSFSDILTPLLVLDVTLVFHHKGNISLSEFIDTKKIDKDILLSIKIKKESLRGYFYKMSKTALDFAIVNVAVSKGVTIKVAVGARPSIAVLATEVMELVNKEGVTEKILEEALQKVDSIKFSTNAKASEEYRRSIAKVYIKRGIKEVITNES
jgi:CO/xanthine dehydrogenase FAD-binding subunit